MVGFRSARSFVRLALLAMVSGLLVVVGAAFIDSSAWAQSLELNEQPIEVIQVDERTPLPQTWLDFPIRQQTVTYTTPIVVQDIEPLVPLSRTPVDPVSSRTPTVSGVPGPVQAALLGEVHGVENLSRRRRARAFSPGADAISGLESRSRVTSDTGNLLGKTMTARGVTSQQRTPIVTDTRVRGERVGQVLAAGSFWTPVRMDLDTMMSKIDSRLIDSLIVIKGPYSPRYGPGLAFVDIELLSSPRFENGYESHGSTSLDYQTNGEQLYGRQTVYGGAQD